MLCLLKRCLQKDKRCRLQDIGDARIELEELLGIRESTHPAVPVVGHKPRAMAVSIGSVVVALVSVAFLGWQEFGRKQDRTLPVTRFSINLAPHERIVASFQPSLELSRHGRMLFYIVPAKAGGFEYYLRKLDELESVEIQARRITRWRKPELLPMPREVPRVVSGNWCGWIGKVKKPPCLCLRVPICTRISLPMVSNWP